MEYEIDTEMLLEPLTTRDRQIVKAGDIQPSRRAQSTGVNPREQRALLIPEEETG